jgi:DNA repair protein RecO
MQVFSDTEGLISVLAKGIRKSKKHEDILLNILNEYEFVMTNPSQSGIHVLVEMTLLSEYPTDLPLETWFTAQAGAEFVTKLLLPDEEIISFYQALSQYLAYQKNMTTNSITIFWRFLMHTYKLLGVPINLTQCSHCHCEMEKPAGYTTDNGQLVCDNCYLTLQTAYVFDPETANLLMLLPVIGNYINDLEISRESIRSLNHFFMHYVSTQFHKTMYLKSLEFYNS